MRALAAKEGKPLSTIRNRVTREAVILRSLDHPNIVKLYDSYECDGKMAIVMEYVKRGELITYIGSEGSIEKDIHDVFVQLLYAIDYSHKHKVI